MTRSALSDSKGMFFFAQRYFIEGILSSAPIDEADVITPLMTPFLSVLADGPVGFAALRGRRDGCIYDEMLSDPARLLESIAETIA